LFKETDPAREKPRGDESKEPGGEEAPRDAERDAFAEPALDEKLRDIDEIKMQRGEKQKPSEWPRVSDQKAHMVPERLPQRFTVEDERDLHGGEKEQHDREQRTRDTNAEIDRGGLRGKPAGEHGKWIKSELSTITTEAHFTTKLNRRMAKSSKC